MLDEALTGRVRRADDDVARAAVQGIVESPAFDGFYARPAGRGPLPVGVMDRETRSGLSSASVVVEMTGDAMLKQKRRHRALRPEDYRALPEVIASPDVVLQRQPSKQIAQEVVRRRRVLVGTAGGTQYAVVVERAPDGSRVRLVSFFPAGDDYLSLLLRSAQRIFRAP